MAANPDWKLYSWVLRGKQRKAVVRCLDEPKIPTQIKDDCGLHITHISKVLKDLVGKGLAECLTPDVRMGKLYRLTKKGEVIRERLSKKTG